MSLETTLAGSREGSGGLMPQPFVTLTREKADRLKTVPRFFSNEGGRQEIKSRTPGIRRTDRP